MAAKPTPVPTDQSPDLSSLVPLQSVLCTEELNRRPSRPPDYERENRALVSLAQALADSPRTILQVLADMILELFQADSAGISLVTEDEKRFHWPAIAGQWKPHIGGGTPRDFGPCGDVLDHNCPLLFRHFERRYTYFLPVTPPVEECLLVPFYVEGKAVGTIWAIAHDDRRKFDSEDRRMLVSLGVFASAAYQAVEQLHALRGQAHDREKGQQSLREMNQALILGSVRQHELTEAADASNAQLQEEITERKRAQAEARVAGERFHRIAESLPQKIFTAKPNGDTDYFNSRWLEFTGLSFEQIKGWGWKQFIHPDDLAESLRAWRHSIDTGAPFHFEHRFRRADGDYRWHISQALALKDAEGKTLMWLGSNTDVHEVKEADNRKSEFLAMLAHELRNPLAPIRNMLEVMKRADGNSELIQPAVGTMERQLRQMTRLIDDLLDVSRISQDKLQVRREQVELASVIAHVVEAARPELEVARHQLTVTLPPLPVCLHADPVRLAQVFGNLLHNACKFTKPGGHVSLTAERQGGDLVVTVKDSGIGIPSDMLPKIFEMFTQGDRTLERLQSGLGIGLTLVRRLVEMHGGSVQAFSEGLDRGSEFVVRLPALLEKPKPPSTDPTVREPTPMTARRILVVDDNHDSANSLAMLLNMSGHQTHLAFDGLEAVEAAATFKPEVILLDIGLPKLNGYDAARRIRKQQWGTGMVLVALTGWGQDEDRKETADAGFNGHLVKPVEFNDLMKLLAGLP